MNVTRVVLLLLAWVGLVVAVLAGTPDALLLVQPRALVIVVVLPWLVAAVVVPARTVLRAPLDALSRGVADLPEARRIESATALRLLGGLSVGVGVVTMFLAAIAVFQVIAASSGAASPGIFLTGTAGGLLAAAYGLALKVLGYDVLAASLEREEEGLGAALGE